MGYGGQLFDLTFIWALLWCFGSIEQVLAILRDLISVMNRGPAVWCSYGVVIVVASIPTGD